MAIVGLALIWTVGFIGAIWFIGSCWNWAMQVRDGRPKLTAEEQLSVDLLRAKGSTTASARRRVLSLRAVRQQIDDIREAEESLFDTFNC